MTSIANETPQVRQHFITAECYVACSTRQRAIATLITASISIALATASATSFGKDNHYRPKRMPDGRPELQGVWLQSNQTPLARIDGIETLAINAEQVATIEKLMADRHGEDLQTEHIPMFKMAPIRGQYRSSIIVDPPNGRVPFIPVVMKQFAARRGDVLEAMDGPEHRPISERCLSNPANQAPVLWTPGVLPHQIVQTNSVVLLVGSFSARIIRLNAKHAPPAVTSWMGDSIGWWQADTLVVETKYFTPSDSVRSTPMIAYMVSPQTTVTERFTRVSVDQIDYTFTVDDPTLYTQLWTGETQFTRSDEQVFEMACHEGNYSLTFILQGARVKDGTWPLVNDKAKTQ